MDAPIGIAAVAGGSWSGGGTSWWQILGAFLLVSGLLVLVLRGLSRWQGRGGAGDLKVLSVTSLGSRRSLEALRYGDEVLLLYRCEGAMVLVDRKDAASYEDSLPPSPVEGLRGRLDGLLKRGD